MKLQHCHYCDKSFDISHFNTLGQCHIQADKEAQVLVNKQAYKELQESHENNIKILKKVRLEIGVLEHNWSIADRHFMPDVIQALKQSA